VWLASDARFACAQEAPLVLAFYYAWYDENTWTSGITADVPLQPYRSADVEVIERHVSQAQAAGIDALVQSWYGPQEVNNQTETNFRALLDVAAGRGFRGAVAFEANSPFFPDQAAVTEALRYLLTVHTQHPAYLRYQGRPVIFFWRQQRFDVGTWNAIRAKVDPDHTSLWIAEGTDLGYQRVFDGHYLYSIAWSSDVTRTLQDWGQRVRRYAGRLGMPRLWVATVMPGYDDTHSGRSAAFAVGRRDGEYYRASWAAAIASQPDWVVITSFNEWVEGTMIEPSVRYGDLYLNLTRELAAQFRASFAMEGATSVSAVMPQAGPVSTDIATVAVAESSPRVRAIETVRIRSGPGTTYPRIGRLERGEQAEAIGRNSDDTWWQIELPGSATLGWVSAAFVELLGDASTLPVVEPPTLTPTAPSDALIATATATRSVVTSAGTRTPTPIKTVTKATVGTPHTLTPTVISSVTPASLGTPAIPLQATQVKVTATVPPFITPPGTHVAVSSVDTTGTPATAPSLQTIEPSVQTSPLVAVTFSPTTAEATLPEDNPLGEGDSFEMVTLRQPQGSTVSRTPLLLWLGSASLLAALVLLVVLYIRVRARYRRGSRSGR